MTLSVQESPLPSLTSLPNNWLPAAQTATRRGRWGISPWPRAGTLATLSLSSTPPLSSQRAKREWGLLFLPPPLLVTGSRGRWRRRAGESVRKRRLGGDSREEPEKTAKTAASRESRTPPTGNGTAGSGSSIPSPSTLPSLCPAGEPQTETPRRVGREQREEEEEEEATWERQLTAPPHRNRRGAAVGARLASQVGGFSNVFPRKEMERSGGKNNRGGNSWELKKGWGEKLKQNGHKEKGVTIKEEAMSREGAILVILIVLCSMLPRTIAFCRLHTHLSQLGVFDLADTERERERVKKRQTSEAASN